jgi:hypothetical protein
VPRFIRVLERSQIDLGGPPTKRREQASQQVRLAVAPVGRDDELRLRGLRRRLRGRAPASSVENLSTSAFSGSSLRPFTENDTSRGSRTTSSAMGSLVCPRRTDSWIVLHDKGNEGFGEPRKSNTGVDHLWRELWIVIHPAFASSMSRRCRTSFGRFSAFIKSKIFTAENPPCLALRRLPPHPPARRSRYVGTPLRLRKIARLRRLEDSAPMEHAPATPGKPLLRWSILVLRGKAVWLGDIEAVSEAEAIAKGAEEFKQPKERLMAVGALDVGQCPTAPIS